MKEKLKHREAFEHYYSLGSERGLRKVAQEFKVSLTAVAKWSIAFNWQERIEQRDIEIGKKLEEKTNEAVVNTKADYRALIKKVVKEFEKRLEAKKIRIAKPEDLSIMAKLDLLMMGEPTERGEHKLEPLKVIIEKGKDE